MSDIREYWVPYGYFCGIRYAAKYGKTCPRLNEVERIMCECAEMGLEDAGSYFRKMPLGKDGSAPVIFRDCELKIPALEHAAREMRTEQVSAAFNAGIAPPESDFPEFPEAVAAEHPSGNVYYTWGSE